MIYLSHSAGDVSDWWVVSPSGRSTSDEQVQSLLAAGRRVLALDLVNLRVYALSSAAQWCPVCRTYHANPGEKTDAGRLTRRCPLLPGTDPRNRP